MTVLLVLVGGAVGASLRYLMDLFVQSRHETGFPWGTFSVNVLGCLVGGVAAGAVNATGGPEWVMTLVVTGFCGALTTFSAFGFETVQLVEAGSLRAAGLNASLTIAVGFAAAAGGWAVAAAVV